MPITAALRTLHDLQVSMFGGYGDGEYVGRRGSEAFFKGWGILEKRLGGALKTKARGPSKIRLGVYEKAVR